MSCGPAMTYWRILAWLFGPSLPLMLVFILYQRFDGTPHFFLHTLMGWDVGLIVLLAAMHYGRRPARWDGILPFLLALYALTPDFVYMAGPFHRDWMDVFLFHVALDEILPFALPMLALIWVVRLVEYVHWWPTPLQHAQDERWRTIVA